MWVKQSTIPQSSQIGGMLTPVMGGLGAAAYSPDLGLVPLGALPMARLPGSGRGVYGKTRQILRPTWKYHGNMK